MCSCPYSPTHSFTRTSDCYKDDLGSIYIIVCLNYKCVVKTTIPLHFDGQFLFTVTQLICTIHIIMHFNLLWHLLQLQTLFSWLPWSQHMVATVPIPGSHCPNTWLPCSQHLVAMVPIPARSRNCIIISSSSFVG